MVQLTTFLVLATSLLVTDAAPQTSPNLFLDGLAAKFGNTGLVPRSEFTSPAFNLSLVISSSCQSQCGVLDEIISCPTRPSCQCSDSIGGKYSVCMECIATQEEPSVGTQQAQSFMNNYLSACKNLGFTLKEQIIVGNSAQQMAMGISSIVAAAGAATYFLL